jgi:hypothetical protein
MNLSPIPQALPPTFLTWHPTYPDLIPRFVRLRPSGQVFWVGRLLPIADLRWKATYPDRLLPRQYPAALQQAFAAPSFYFTAVPKFASWRPTFPDRLLPRRAPNGGITRWTVDALTLLTSATCVEWTSETVISPILTPESAILPTITEEAVVTPTLSEEDLC